jgi:rhamnose transport system permease protein
MTTTTDTLVAAASGGPPTRTSGATRATRRLHAAREFGIALALALLIAVTAIKTPRFLDGQSVKDLLLNSTILVILAVGQAIVIITRNVDLSVGSIMGLTAFAAGYTFQSASGTPIVVVFAMGLAMGAVLGAVNGALVAVTRVPALVVTLGTLYVFRGVDYLWATGKQIVAGDMPDAFLALGTRSVLGVPVFALFAVVVVTIVGYYLRTYRSGRELYAIGSQPDAAVLSGIPVGRRVFSAFVANGVLAGLAGVLYSARYGTLDANVGIGIELDVVAAVVVGGVAIFGGSGTVFGAALGALLLTTIVKALPLLGLTVFWQPPAVGALLLAAIGLDRALAVRAASRLKGRRANGRAQ